jgi:hypothetical protein
VQQHLDDLFGLEHLAGVDGSPSLFGKTRKIVPSAMPAASALCRGSLNE